MNGRKCKVVRITGELMTEFLTQGYERHVKCLEGLPPGAECVSHYYDVRGDEWWFRYWHESFPEVAKGEPFPYITPLMGSVNCGVRWDDVAAT